MGQVRTKEGIVTCWEHMRDIGLLPSFLSRIEVKVWLGKLGKPGKNGYLTFLR